MTTGINRSLAIVVCDDADDAIAKGYDYKAWTPQPKPLDIEKAVVIRGGTIEGNSTVDLILIDEDGNQYVTMITGRLLKMLPL